MALDNDHLNPRVTVEEKIRVKVQQRLNEHIESPKDKRKHYIDTVRFPQK